MPAPPLERFQAGCLRAMASLPTSHKVQVTLLASISQDKQRPAHPGPQGPSASSNTIVSLLPHPLVPQQGSSSARKAPAQTPLPGFNTIPGLNIGNAGTANTGNANQPAGASPTGTLKGWQPDASGRWQYASPAQKGQRRLAVSDGIHWPQATGDDYLQPKGQRQQPGSKLRS